MVVKTLENLTELKGEDLLPQEKILYNSLSSWYGEMGTLIPGGIAFLIGMVILIYNLISGSDAMLFLISGVLMFASVVLVFMSVYGHYSVRYFITSKRVLKRTGLLSKHLDAIPYSKIQNIEMHKKIGEMMVDIGDIFLDVAGGPDVELVLDNLPDPEKPHRIIASKMAEG